MNKDRLTVPQKLLLAGLEVSKRSATFTAEDLVVEAWKRYPDTFGLSGYSERYPDSNRVLTKIMGTQGMRGKGWLRKVGEKQYRLTSAALAEGETLIATENAPGGRSERVFLRAELDRQAAAHLARIVSTPAARKAILREADNVTFNDACGFWDITARSNANTLNARLADVTVLLERTRETLASKDNGQGLKIGQVEITLYQVNTLLDLHRDMQARFKSELDILRRRTDERIEKRARPFG